VKFGLLYEMQLPRPLDSDQWHPDDEYRMVQQTLEQVELADRLGFDHVFFVEHHFLEEYSISSAPELMLAAAAARESATALEPADESARALYRAGRRGLFIGSPSYIRDNLCGYEQARVDAVLFFVQCGMRAHEHICESLELFGTAVMPEFQKRHHLHQRWREQQLEGVRLPINSSI
jgi:alkanesulfonate monooxygenase SsuD/methylene tetrahydromethanopterin reductase-like flavin-dependent oxidoreductase (luciferase family)